MRCGELFCAGQRDVGDEDVVVLREEARSEGVAQAAGAALSGVVRRGRMGRGGEGRTYL